MRNIQQNININSNWNCSEIAFVKSLVWSNNDLTIVFYSQEKNIMKGWPDLSRGFRELSIKFQNVINLKLDFKGKGIHQVSGFDIMNISENGLEGINFQIEDYENDSIKFFCEEVVINSMSEPHMIRF